MSNQATSLVAHMAQRFGVDADKLYASLTKVAFAIKIKDSATRAPTPEEMLSLLLVCEQYQLNPFTKQIHAFLSKSGVVVPVVGIDGWLAILNRQTDYDGMEVEYSPKIIKIANLDIPESCNVKIYRKGLSKPVSISEFAQECFVETSSVWKKFPRRMLRHKAIIQAVRVAFGISGIYDEDEASNIINGEAIEVPGAAPAVSAQAKPALLPNQSHEELQKTIANLTRLAISKPEIGWQRAYAWADENLGEADCAFVRAALEKEERKHKAAQAEVHPKSEPAAAAVVQPAAEVFDDWDAQQGA